MLTVEQLYDILKLRQDVFVLEQTCLYPDIDDADQHASHLFAYSEDGQQLIAYARILAPGRKYSQAAIGRVLTHEQTRGTGLGKALMQQAICLIEAEYSGCEIKISAQQHLEAFYQGLKFNTVSEPYDEDGIMHIDMLRT